MANKVRILYVERSIEGMVGGSHHSLYQMVVGVMSHGIEPVVIFYEKNDISDKLISMGCEVHFFKFTKRLRVFGEKHRNLRIFKAINSFLTIVKSVLFTGNSYRKWIRDNKISLVHLNNNPFSLEWVSAAKFARIPCVAHQRGARERLDRSEIVLANSVDKVFCISKYVRDSLKDSGCKGSNFSLVYNGIDINNFENGSKEAIPGFDMKTIEGRVVIGLVGNIKPWKGQHILVEALKSIVIQCPRVLCVFVGSFEKSNQVYENNLKKSILESGLSSNVLFTAYTPYVKNYMNMMDIVVHASTDPEPFGRVIIEAMALAKPVVATVGGGASEILEDEVTGILIQPGEPKLLAEALLALICNREKRVKLSSNAYLRVADKFRIEDNVNSIINEYRSLLQGL